MGLITVVGQALLYTVSMLVAATVLVVGRSGIARARRHFRSRLRTVAPHGLALGAILAINEVARTVGPELSWAIGLNVTSLIYEIEGATVAWIQSAATPALTAYFSFVYLYGYTFLLVFPLVAYFTAVDSRPLRMTAVAFAINYAVGVVCYVLFIAYGPRNLMPETVESLLYTTYPQAQLLTREVNVNTNVFPSLHSSLSVTVAALSWRTRDVYPRWTAIATVLATSVVLATMYLGIHWVTDVVAGVALALASVYGADRMLARSDDHADPAHGTPAD